MKKTITTIILLAFAIFGFAQTNPSWVRFSAPSNYQNYNATEVSVGVDTIGNVYTAASVWDSLANTDIAMLVKYSPSGTELWKKFYDNNDAASYYNGTYAVSVLVDKAGNSYVCGQGRHGAGYGRDFMVMKYNNAGNQVWLRYIDGGQGIDDYITCATFDAAGNIVVAGNASFQGTNQFDIMVVKYSPAGVLQWNYLFDGTTNGEDVARALATDAANNVYVTGNTYGTTKRNMVSIKLNSSGSHQWTNIESTTGGGDEFGYGIAADALGNCYVTGALANWTTIKYGPSGSTLWTNHYTANDLSGFNNKKVLLDRMGNVIVAGDAFALGGNSSDLAVNKINSTTGAAIWSVTYNFGGSDRYSSATLDTAGNVYICGYHDGPLGGDLSVVGISATGIVGWNTTYSNSMSSAGGDRAYEIAIDKNRNVILAGIAQTRANGSSLDDVDVITLKYSTPVVGIKTNNFPELQLTVFPNPCTDQFNITSFDHDLKGAEITVMNAIGQTLIKKTWSSETQEINTAQLPKGMYLVTITKGEATTTKRLVIQ
jgi:hypothetical protein